jgi:hypothetical protein
MKDWNEDRYLELNAYFKIKIQRLIEEDPYLKNLIESQKGLQLADIVERMSEGDQNRWVAFIRLDKIKMQIDLQNHLEGKGKPYDPSKGFYYGSTKPDESNPW